MSLLNNTIAAARFEIRRCLTAQRLAVGGFLAAFPVMMLTLITIANRGSIPEYNFVVSLFVYIIGILSLLLWATPNVYSELESKGWIFLASRSRGRISVLLGKYFAAVVASWIICSIAATMCLLFTSCFGMLPSMPLIQLWLIYLAIISLAVLAYGAVFSLIGTMFQKRSMVIAAIYTFVSEVVLGSIPAIISRFTPRFYLSGLAFEWLEMRGPIQDETDVDLTLFIGDMSNTTRVLCLLVGSAVVLAAACYVIRYREYVMNDEA